MAYLSENSIKKMGFKKIGNSVQISDKACIYNCDQIEIGNYSRIDDFCVLSGKIEIGNFCHITPMCLVAGGKPGIKLFDFCTLAYGVKVFAQSDDYSGETMVNSLIPKKFKNEKFSSVSLGKHVIIGAGSIVFPGVHIAEGCAIGAMTLVNRSTETWGVYVGNPARRAKERKKDLLVLESNFLKEFNK